jgi:hypothetical protein
MKRPWFGRGRAVLEAFEELHQGGGGTAVLKFDLLSILGLHEKERVSSSSSLAVELLE